MLCMATALAQNWNENTRDAAYEAPNSVLTNTTWEEYPDVRLTFFSNGTFTLIQGLYSDRLEMSTEISTPGTWRRNKTLLTMTVNYPASSIKAKNTANLSARRLDEVKSYQAEYKAMMRKKTLRRTNMNCYDWMPTT